MHADPAWWNTNTLLSRTNRLLCSSSTGEQAKRYCEEILRRRVSDHDRARALLQLSEINYRMQHYNDAKQLCREVLKLSMREWYSFDAVGKLAQYYRAEQKWDRACILFQKRLCMLPRTQDERRMWAYIDLADTYRDSGNYERARYWDQKLFGLPDIPESFRFEAGWRLAELRERTGDAAGALAMYTALESNVQKDEHRGLLNVKRAYIYLSQKNYEQARTLFQQSIQLSKNAWFSLDAWNGIAEIFRQEGKWQDAITTYEELLSRVPKSDNMRRGWTLLSLADCYRSIGNDAKAHELYEDILNICSNNSDLIKCVRERGV